MNEFISEKEKKMLKGVLKEINKVLLTINNDVINSTVRKNRKETFDIESLDIDFNISRCRMSTNISK